MKQVLSWLYIGNSLHAQQHHREFEKILNLGELNENIRSLSNYRHFQMCDHGTTDFSNEEFLNCIEWLNKEEK